MTLPLTHNPAQSAEGSSDSRPPVLFLSGVKGDTRRYRSFHAWEQMRLQDVPCALAHITDAGLEKQVEAAAVVIFHRVTWNRHVERLVQRLRQRGALILLDTDDLTFDPAAFQWIDSPDFQDPVRAALYQEDLRRNRLTLDHCQAALTSCGYLAEQVRRLGKPAWVHRNAFSLEMLARSEQALLSRTASPEKLVIGYASGTPTHNRDFALITPALQTVLRRFPQVELWTIGPLQLDPSWQPFQSRIRQLPLVPWRDLPNLLKEFDINLAPLVMTNPFGQSKSEIKFVEAALVRVPTIASPTDAFSYAIRSGENGCLAEGEASWVEALEQLISHPDQRQALAECAYHDVLERYHPTRRADELVAILTEISQHLGKPLDWGQGSSPSAGSLAGGWIDPDLENQPSLLRMGLYNLRHRGPKTLLGRVWVFFRRMLAPIFPYRGRRK